METRKEEPGRAQMQRSGQKRRRALSESKNSGEEESAGQCTMFSDSRRERKPRWMILPAG
jgi:hypothetical protein